MIMIIIITIIITKLLRSVQILKDAVNEVYGIPSILLLFSFLFLSVIEIGDENGENIVVLEEEEKGDTKDNDVDDGGILLLRRS